MKNLFIKIILGIVIILLFAIGFATNFHPIDYLCFFLGSILLGISIKI